MERETITESLKSALQHTLSNLSAFKTAVFFSAAMLFLTSSVSQAADLPQCPEASIQKPTPVSQRCQCGKDELTTYLRGDDWKHAGGVCEVGQYCILKLSPATDQSQYSHTNYSCSNDKPMTNLAKKDAVAKYAKEQGWEKQEIDPEIESLLEDIKNRTDYASVNWFKDRFGKEHKPSGKQEAKNLKSTFEKMSDWSDPENLTQASSRSDDKAKDVRKWTDDLLQKGAINEAERDKLVQYADKMLSENLNNLEESLNEIERKDEARKTNEVQLDVAANLYGSECPTSDIVRAKYQAGCWSCLVVEKLTSSFLRAASGAYGLAQKAGLVVLGLGSVLWLLLWGLRNVSSLAQLEPGNILNELIKFGFKVALAYIGIALGMKVVGTYFINPMMGMGAKIAEVFWEPEKIAPYTEEYIWEDEVVTAAQEAAMTAQIAENNKKLLENNKTGGSGQAAVVVPGSGSGKAELLVQPQPYAYDSTEELVQDIQKALITVLRKQLGEIKNSCGGSCGSCRYASCKNAGHQSYVSSIHKAAKSGFGGNTAYCQAAIVAGMNKLTEMIGGDATTVLSGVGANCAAGLNLGVKKNAFTVSSIDGGNVTLCRNGKLVPQTLNVGDTIYYHKVTTSEGSSQKMGATSGYHAVTYAGGGQAISFNGDSEGSVCNSYYYNVEGRVLCVSCLIRDKLKKNPALAKGINQSGLKSLAQGYGNFTLRNYNGSVYSNSNISGDFGTGGNSSVPMVTIEKIAYSGPTDIMSKEVMNSILGATAAIGDITSENMVLGDVIMCYAGLANGGAWANFGGIVITNFWMWMKGAFIWVTGMLLTLSFCYYLLDLSFKIGIAVVALPICMGLWPFELTKDKLSVCISMIARGAALFAFLAMTTTYTVMLTDAVFSYEDIESETGEVVKQSPDAPSGLARLYEAADSAASGVKNEDDIEYINQKMEFFSVTFILLLFAFLYSYKLVENTSSQIVDKFFSDKALGGQSPMHNWARAATKWAGDKAMAPVKWGRDVALYQGGQKLKSGIGKGMGKLRSAFGGKKDGGPKAGASSDGKKEGASSGGQEENSGGAVLNEGEAPNSPEATINEGE